MKLVLLAGMGSFIGGTARYLIALPFQNKLIFYFPFGTLIANIVGCFLIGILFALAERGVIAIEGRVFLITGILGGFTTFSSFSLETIEMFRDGYLTKAILYIMISVVVGLLATLFAILLTGD